jgi:peptide-methionine (S)-S-oxide reductase
MISSLLDLLGGGGSFDKSQLIDPSKALPGRSQKMPNIDGLKHYVLGNRIDHVPEDHQVAVFANGVSSGCLGIFQMESSSHFKIGFSQCFWGSEKGIWRLPKGIYSTAVGYCAGFTPNPTYE